MRGVEYKLLFLRSRVINWILTDSMWIPRKEYQRLCKGNAVMEQAYGNICMRAQCFLWQREFDGRASSAVSS